MHFYLKSQTFSFFFHFSLVAVHCKDTRIAVQVRTNKPFNGRIYALGRSETCNIDVLNSDAFRLDLTMGGQDCNTQSVVSNLRHLERVCTYLFLNLSKFECPFRWKLFTLFLGHRFILINQTTIFFCIFCLSIDWRLFKYSCITTS